MKWRKLGLIYQPTFQSSLFEHSAMVPTPIAVTDDSITFLVTRCSKDGIGRAAQVTLAPERTSPILSEVPEPVLDIGRPGMFDDNGVVPCCQISLPSGQQILYYVGFELSTKIRYRLFSGAAVRENGSDPFVRKYETPILDRRPGEAFFRGGPFVLQEGNLFRMWYVAGDEWIEVGGHSKPVYELRYLESSDPLSWNGPGQVCLRLGPDDHGFGRPWIVKSDGRYQLFFSRRSLKHQGAYRLGYAESDNGIDWHRKDSELNLDVSEAGWDSQAIMYSAVVKYQNQTWCFYNGNEFGREGFGAAVLEEP